MTDAGLGDRFDGETTKRYTLGTHRAADPVELLSRVESLLPLAGVTRLADITGLDRTGIPCFSAVRPLATTLSVASGKGVSRDAAAVSAAMEAIEVFSAETVELPEVCEPHGVLAPTRVCPTLDDLALRKHALIRDGLPIRWTFGWDLLTGADAAIPLDLVTLG